jgi:hypothetical protein
VILLEQSIAAKPFKPCIEIDDNKLRELWSKGILSDLSYVSFALELHNKSSLDLQQFSRDWSVEDLAEDQILDGWKAKTLKIRAILNAICVLDSKGLAACDFNAKVTQLGLFD